MTPQQAMDILHRANIRLCKAGYVVSGTMAFIRPREPGRVESVAFADYGPVNALRVVTQGLGGSPVHAERPRPVMSPGQAVAVLVATGEICSRCGGSNFVPSGTCKTCADCGTSGGCS